MGTRIIAGKHDAANPIGEAGRRRVLVVDDEATIRTIVAEVLKVKGFDVLVAMNGLEALEICSRDPGRIDVLLTDLQMPVMGGEELVRRAMRIRPGLRTICLSAGFSEVCLEGAVLFLPKPFTLMALLSTVRAALEGPDSRQTMTA